MLTDRQHTSPEDSGMPGHARGARSQFVYEALRREILALELSPSSTLDETLLSARFGMSRAPIREALNRLASQNMVVMAPNRPTTVAPLNLQDFPDYADALDLLQRANSRLAAAHRRDADIARIRRLADAFDTSLDCYDPIEMSAANKAFHMAIAAAGRNRYLMRNYEALLDEGRRLLHLQFRFLRDSGGELPQSQDHHLMADAIEARDADRADRLAHDHTKEFQTRFLKYLAHNEFTDMDLSPLDRCGHDQ